MNTKTNFVTGIAIVILSLSTQSSFAFDACDAYADTAVLQQQNNVQNRCAFDGLRWQSNRHAHKSYCELVGPDIAGLENIERQRLLNQCFLQENNGNNGNNGNNNQNAFPQLSGEYTIRQKSNGREMDAYHNRNDNKVVTRDLQSNNSQVWIFNSLGNEIYTIRQKSSGMYLDAHQGRNDNSVVTRNNQNNDTQRWIVRHQGNDVYTLQQKSNGRYLDAHQGRNDNSVVTRNNQNNDTQRWVIR